MGEEALDLLRVMSASGSVESAPGTIKTVRYLLSIEKGTTEKDFRCFTGSQCQDLALTVLFVPYLLDSGRVHGFDFSIC